MKKLLLTFAAACAVTAASAAVANITKVWGDEITKPFSDGNTVYNATLAIDSKGAVIAASGYDTDLTIDNTALDAIGTSAYIVKYTADGSLIWATGIVGSVTINNIVTDADDNIYIAGQYADVITFKSVAGNDVYKEGMTFDGAPTVEQNSAFIAQYSSDGNLSNVRTFIPEIQPALLPLIDDWASDVFYFYYDGSISFNIADMKLSDNRLYVGVTYTGITKIDDITLDASYVNYGGWLYDDNKCAAIFSLDNTLGNAKIVDQLVSTVNNGDYTDDSYVVWNMRFDIKGESMVVAYTGSGELSYQGGTIPLMTNDDYDVLPVFIFSTLEHGNFIGKKVIPTADAMYYTFNAISDIKIAGINAFAVGHKYTKTTEDENDTYTHDIFVATIPGLNVENTELTSTLAIDSDLFYLSNGAAINDNGEIFIPTLAYYNKEVGAHKNGDLAGNGVTFTYSADTFSNSDYNATAAVAEGASVAFANVEDAATTISLYTAPAAGISDIIADENAPVEYFNLQGVHVDNPENGLYIVRQGNKVTKQIIR